MPAGGPTDVLGRVVGEYLGRDLKQVVVVENKAGAQGAIGAEAVARSDPDGYTLFVTAASIFVLNPLLYKKLPYDPARDFRLLSVITDSPMIMEVNPSVPAKTVAEFVAYARKNPGKLNFGSAGTGGTVHLAGEMFKQMAGVEMTHVPYKGAGPALQDLLSGNIQLMFDTLGTALPPVKSGMLRALGVSSHRAHSGFARPADDRRERLSRLCGQRLVWYCSAVEGAWRDRRQDQGEPRPGLERRGVSRFAGQDRLSAAAPEEPGRDRQVRGDRSRAVGGRGQGAQHIAGLTHGT